MGQHDNPLKTSLGVILFALATTLTLSMWIAHQGGFAAQLPAKFAATVYLLVEGLPILAAVWCAAAGFGYPVVRWLLPTAVASRPVVQLATGMALLLWLNWLLAWSGGLVPITAWGVCAIGLGLLGMQIFTDARNRAGSDPNPDPVTPTWIAPLWVLATWMPGLAMLLVASTCPPGTLWQVEAFGYDVTSYHLQLPREWIELGRMQGLEHNVYSFLPSLMETSYMLLGQMRGDMAEAVYTCQLFHASLAVLAAVCLSAVAWSFVSPAVALLAGGLFLMTPWTLILGSLAYNEMAVFAFGAAALMLAFDARSETHRLAAAIGALLGVATLAKPTAGPMLAVPLGLLLLSRYNHALRWRKPPTKVVGLRCAALAALAGLITLSPYLIRNAVQTGNPVFPFAMSTLGAGHFDQTLQDRWDRAHHRTPGGDNAFVTLQRQWLRNAGYGAVGGTPTPTETQNIARFRYELGIPVFWLAVLLMTATALPWQATRRAALAMVALLVLQAGFWLMATHWQSRFMAPSLIPGCILIALGLGSLTRTEAGFMRYPGYVLAILLPVVLISHTLGVFWAQTRPLPDAEGAVAPAGVYQLVDALQAVGNHPIDRLPVQSQTLLVADAGSLFYIDRPFVYNTAFDHDTLGTIVREIGTQPDAINAELRRQGFTHVWYSRSEAKRLRGTYGFDDELTLTLLQALTRSWQPLSGSQRSGLFAIPAP